MIDFQSPAWHLIRKWAEAEVSKCRQKNDALGLSVEETSALRGEIRAYKKLLGLPEQVARGVVGIPVE